MTTEQRMTPRDVVDAAWMLTWFVSSILVYSGIRSAVIGHLFLPWIAVGLAFRYPQDFTLLIFGPQTKSRKMVGTWLVLGVSAWGNPTFVRFVGGDGQFVKAGLLIGGSLFLAATAVSLVAERSLRGIVRSCLILIVLCGLYGYVAGKESNVLFDLSTATTYRTSAITDARHPMRSATQIIQIGPWGPVSTNSYVSSSSWGSSYYKGDPVCIALRRGALGVPWYAVEECPGK